MKSNFTRQCGEQGLCNGGSTLWAGHIVGKEWGRSGQEVPDYEA